MLQCVAVCCRVFHRVAVCCSVLHRVASSPLRTYIRTKWVPRVTRGAHLEKGFWGSDCGAVWCSVAHCVVLCCSVSTMCCRGVHLEKGFYGFWRLEKEFLGCKCCVICCSVLLCVAVCCNVLPRAGVQGV